jgi:hypothetical protein
LKVVTHDSTPLCTAFDRKELGKVSNGHGYNSSYKGIICEQGGDNKCYCLYSGVDKNGNAPRRGYYEIRHNTLGGNYIENQADFANNNVIVGWGSTPINQVLKISQS